MPIGEFYQNYGPIRRRRNPDADPLEDQPRQPRSHPQRSSPLRIAILILLTLCIIAIGFPYGVDFIYRDQSWPALSVQGLAVAGMTREQVKAKLDERYGPFMQQPLLLTAGDHHWAPSLADLGATLDLDALSNDVVGFGRGFLPKRYQDLWQVWIGGGSDIPPYLTIDRAALQRYLIRISGEYDHPPLDAVLSLAGGKIVAIPSGPGQQLLIDAAADEVIAALAKLQPAEIALSQRSLAPRIDDSDLAAATQQASLYLSTPITLTHQRGPEQTDQWVWDAAKLSELLQVYDDDGRIGVRLYADRMQIEVDRLAQVVDSGSVEPRLSFVSSGLRIVKPGEVGWRLRKTDAVQLLTTAILSSTSPVSRTIALPVDPVTPQITADTLPTLGITELVAEGRSSFAGSAQYRITNIEAGARLMNGVLIAPGDEFSFNTQVGEIDEAHGFVEGYAIIGNRTQLEWGGGICQVSTTVFRAAFWAGVPITERQAHAFYISWYDRFGLGENGDGAGLDATIYTGVQDFRFLNDTGHWLLLQTTVDEANQILSVDLYGTKPNRRVMLEGPFVSSEVPAPSQPVYINDPGQPRGYLHQTDSARGGRDIRVERVIIENDIPIHRDAFNTHFQAWPNVFVRGTG